MSRAPFDPPLLLITDRRRFAAPEASEAISASEWRALESAIRAGIGALELREKDLDGRPLLERAQKLVGPCRDAGVRLLVNDRVDVALGAEADGVHLPADGLPVADARRLLGARALIGRSIHRREELARCEGADYVVFGPIFDTPSKRPFGPPQGLTKLDDVVRASALPVLAIGGITAERVRAVLDHGAAGVAIIGAILDADDPASAVRALVQRLER